MIETIATLDTIALYKDYNSIDDILKYDIKQNIRKYFNLNSNSENKAFTYTIYEKLKNAFYSYGIENIIITKSTKTKDKYRVGIKFNAKLLQDDYLKGINKDNINIALNKILRTLEPYFKIKFDDFKSFCVGMVDYTKNILIDTAYKISDVLKSIDYYSQTNRELQSISKIYIDNGTLTFQLSNKEKMLIYDKHRELLEKKNALFIASNKNVLSKAKNILRIETRIKKQKRIAKLLNIKLLDNQILNIYDVLNSDVNIAYIRLEKYTKSIKENKILNNISSLDDLSQKDFDNLLLAKSYLQYFNNDIEAIKEKIKSKAKSRQTASNRLKKILNGIRILKALENNTQKIDFRELLDYTLNQLKVA